MSAHPDVQHRHHGCGCWTYWDVALRRSIAVVLCAHHARPAPSGEAAELPGDDRNEPDPPPLVPLCAHHRAVIFDLAQKDHVDDRESDRVAAEMRRQCCGRGL